MAKIEEIRYLCNRNILGKMQSNDWKKRLGVVYPTNPDFQYNDESHKEAAEVVPAGKQKLRILLERSGRAGKVVTLVTGFRGSEDELKALGKELKVRCGVGGTVKDGEITVQGDLRDKVVSLLWDMGYVMAKRGN